MLIKQIKYKILLNMYVCVLMCFLLNCISCWFHCFQFSSVFFSQFVFLYFFHCLWFCFVAGLHCFLCIFFFCVSAFSRIITHSRMMSVLSFFPFLLWTFFYLFSFCQSSDNYTTTYTKKSSLSVRVCVAVRAMRSKCLNFK